MKAKIYSLLLASVVVAGGLLSGCNSNHDRTTASRDFEISVTNLSTNQPFSPLAVLFHQPAYQLMSVGQAASQPLEMLAESGDNSALLAAAAADPQVSQTASGIAAVSPGASDTQMLTAVPEGSLRLSVLAMLVNTNDGFIALDGVDVEKLAAGDTWVLQARAYDAGTEGNSEMQAEIPGPAAGGEGFNVARNDRDFVTVHPGVISHDDGLTTSILDVSHRFDNPVARIEIRRIR